MTTTMAMAMTTMTTQTNWTVQKWWPIYARGIELITILLQEHSCYFLKDILQFVGIHEEYLIDSLLLCKQSLEPLAINLMRCTITFLANLVEYEKCWRLEHSQSLFSLMVSDNDNDFNECNSIIEFQN